MQRAYYKIITETPITSMDKLSVMVPWSKVIVWISFVREQYKDKTGIGLVKTNWNRFSAACLLCREKSKSEAQ